jgi:uncharacterized protein YqeY
MTPTPNEKPIRQRLKDDLKQAMKARQTEVVTTLRTTLAEIDHAESVDVDPAFVPIIGVTNDVPRKVLTEAEMLAIVQREADEIQAAMAEYEAAGNVEKTAELCAAWELLQGYLEA